MKNATKPLMEIFNSLIREGFEKFGRYYSSYRGFVADVEDPDSLSRLKLVVPQITGKMAMDYWAWPKHVFSGDGYGSQILPKKGDMVWVEFEMGNPRKPTWYHGHFSFKPDGKTNEKPSNLKDVKNYWFKTPEGNLIEFDDTNGWVLLTPNDKFLVGSKNADEPAVLGNILKSKINDLCEISKDIALASAQITVITLVGQSSVPVNAADFAQSASDIIQLETELNQILSKIMFIKE